MRKPSRNLVRSRGKRVLNTYNQMVCLFRYEQTASSWKDWAFRTVSLRQALQQVADGEANPITRMIDGEVRTIGFQSQKPELQGNPTATCLTDATTEAVSNAVGKKKDLALTPGEREEIFKFDVWATIGDTKAPCVRPRVDAAYLAKADKFLGSAPRPLPARISRTTRITQTLARAA